jgi:hypothetical protein
MMAGLRKRRFHPFPNIINYAASSNTHVKQSIQTEVINLRATEHVLTAIPVRSSVSRVHFIVRNVA